MPRQSCSHKAQENMRQGSVVSEVRQVTSKAGFRADAWAQLSTRCTTGTKATTSEFTMTGAYLQRAVEFPLPVVMFLVPAASYATQVHKHSVPHIQQRLGVKLGQLSSHLQGGLAWEGKSRRRARLKKTMGMSSGVQVLPIRQSNLHFTCKPIC